MSVCEGGWLCVWGCMPVAFPSRAAHEALVLFLVENTMTGQDRHLSNTVLELKARAIGRVLLMRQRGGNVYRGRAENGPDWQNDTRARTTCFPYLELFAARGSVYRFLNVAIGSSLGELQMKNGLFFTFMMTAMLAAGAAQAHTGEGVAGGLISGFLHPLFGWDHVVAMVAVGLWGAVLGLPALWLLPVVFPVVMALGGALGVVGVPLPAVETGIALSGVVLGLLVAFAVRAPLWIAALIVGAFAVFHGHAHGTELPAAADPIAYAVGFVIATGFLHLAGIAIGLLWGRPWGNWAVRVAGVFVALVGAAFLAGVA